MGRQVGRQQHRGSSPVNEGSIIELDVSPDDSIKTINRIITTYRQRPLIHEIIIHQSDSRKAPGIEGCAARET